jgi:ribonuclease HI
VIRADGAARGNPGPASCGAVLIDASVPGALEPDAAPLAVIARALGTKTNNVAEYTGVLLALRLAQRLGAAEVDLVLDSNLVVEQLNLRWKVRDVKLRPLFAEVRRLLAGFRRWSAVHEPRERNRAADALCNLALDDPQAAAEAERRFAGRFAEADGAPLTPGPGGGEATDVPGQPGFFDPGG